MVHKRSAESPAPETVVPTLAPTVAAEDLVVPTGLDFSSYDVVAAGDPHRLGDYEVGERIDHVDGVTLTDAEHMMATRLWQNTAKVHFNTDARPDGRRLVYGGHVISLARALSFNGLANAQLVAAINAGAHVAPAFAGDTVHAWSEVLDTATLDAPGVGALRLRLVATRGRDESMTLRGDDEKYADGVLLDLDYWALVPR
jgi:2-methylfumaryl-CoA hydratase